MNGEDAGSRLEPMDYTLYVDPSFVVRPNAHYTKHIFMGGERITSKVGEATDLLVNNINLGAEVGKKTDMQNRIKANQGLAEQEYAIPYNDIPIDKELGFLNSSTELESNRYYFCNDHLGSSSYITDADGVVIQHIEYMPFGETFVEENRFDWATIYKFNGKEIDCESGLYNYGARYYDPKVSRWLSVDPLADAMPSWSPYNYTFNNPVNFIDPNGKEPIKPGAIGLSEYILILRVRNIDPFDVLQSGFYLHGGYLLFSSGDSKFGGKRYLYSKRWGWIDMRHFFAAAKFTDNVIMTGNYVLSRGEKNERQQGNAKDGGERASSFAYEDLVSNLLGMYFEEYLENSNDRDEFGVLEKYLEEIGVVEDVTTAKIYKDLRNKGPKSKRERKPKNKTYKPRYTQEKNDHPIDLKILERLDRYKNN